MNDAPSAAGDQDERDTEQESATGGSEERGRRPQIQLIVFCTLLILAMIGMGVTESREDGGWEYWIFLVLVYGLTSVTLAWRQAKQRGEPVWRMIRKQVLHWVGALVTLKSLFLLEKTDIMSREAVSDVSVIILALVCFLAGVHFQWMFLLIGIFVGIMAMTLAYTEQYIVWLIMIPSAAIATWLYLKFRATRSN